MRYEVGRQLYSQSLVVELKIIIGKLKVALNERTENLRLSPGSEVSEMVGEYTYFWLIPTPATKKELQQLMRSFVNDF